MYVHAIVRVHVCVVCATVYSLFHVDSEMFSHGYVLRHAMFDLCLGVGFTWDLALV